MRLFRAVLIALAAGGLTVAGQYLARDAAAGDVPAAGPLPALTPLVDVVSPAPVPAPAAADVGPPPRELIATARTGRRATARTANFAVSAPTERDAEELAQLCERERKQRALEWLGREMLPWDDPCPVRVEYGEKAGGVTVITWRGDRVTGREIEVHGARDWVRGSGLPHEVTHTVIRHVLGRQAPRWCDEGAATQSESAAERRTRENACVGFLNEGKGTKLAWLFRQTDYPKGDEAVQILYAQSCSVTAWLVSRTGKPGFLEFCVAGMRDGWEAAAKSAGFRDVEDLEAQWIESLRTRTRRPREADAPRTESRVESNWWWLVPGSAAAAAFAAKSRADRRGSNA